jgi:hypothetical protein
VSGDHELQPRPWFLTWRVSYWRARWDEPRRETFGRRRDAERFARKVARYRDAGPSGPVTRIEIAERLTTAWAPIWWEVRQDLAGDTDDPSRRPDQAGE